MNDDFWNRMEKVSQVMTDLEAEHQRFFSEDEKIQLLEYKKNFVESIIFWTESNNTSVEERTNRIRWEYNNMFDLLCRLIDKNVEDWESNTNNNRNDDYDDYDKKEEF